MLDRFSSRENDHEPANSDVETDVCMECVMTRGQAALYKDPEGIMLGDTRQVQKDKHSMISLLCGIQSQSPGREIRFVSPEAGSGAGGT